MKTLLLFIILTFTFLFSFSGLSQSVNGDIDYLGQNYIVSVDKSDKTTVGSPYVNPNFVAAKVSTNETLMLLVRYNAIADEIEVKKDDEQIFAFNKTLKDVKLNLVVENKIYQLFDYVHKDTGYDISGYFVHLGNPDNNIKFLKKEIVVFQKEKLATSSYDKTKPAEFKRKSDDYYVKIGDDKPIKLSSDKKDFAEMFPKQKEEILDYIKSEKIKLNNDDDFTKLSVFINLLK